MKFPAFYGTPNIRYHIHKSPPPVPILSQINPFHALPPSHYLKVHLDVSFPLLWSYQSISPRPRHGFTFRNKASSCDEELSALCPNPKLQDHPSSTFRDSLFCIFAATVHNGGRSSIRNLRTRHAVVTGTHLLWLI
jgi:hypothetical protein